VARTSKTKPLQAGKWTVNQSMASQTQPVDTSMPRYFYTHANFYAITQYNHSVLYAMAVYDLSVAIAQAKLAFDQQQPNHSSSAIQ
jgi:membrane-bound lytic murein transglycosylase B